MFLFGILLISAIRGYGVSDTQRKYRRLTHYKRYNNFVINSRLLQMECQATMNEEIVDMEIDIIFGNNDAYENYCHVQKILVDWNFQKFKINIPLVSAVLFVSSVRRWPLTSRNLTVFWRKLDSLTIFEDRSISCLVDRQFWSSFIRRRPIYSQVSIFRNKTVVDL